MSSTFRKTLLVVASGLLLCGITTPAIAQDRANESDDIVVLTGRVEVPEGETVGDVVIFDGPASIDGTVDGDVVAFNGRVTVTGAVQGDVMVFNGRAVIEQDARIDGDVKSRTKATIAPGAEVGGDTTGLDFRFVDDALAAVRLGVWVAITVSAFLLLLAFVFLFPRVADALMLAGESRMGATIGWGIALFFGIPILAVVLLVTIVGIPLGVGLLLAIAPFYAVAYTFAAYFLGRRIVGPPRSQVVAALAGLAILRAAALVPVLGGLVWFVATVFGLGLMAVAARGRSGSRAAPQGTPAAV
jgi:hypothetical protein